MNFNGHLKIVASQVLLYLLVLFPVSLFSAESELEIVGLHYPPYIIKGDDGQVSGVFVDLVSRAFSEMGYQPRFNISNWARAYAAIQSGQADAIFPAHHSEERESFLYYPSYPVWKMKMVLISSARNSIAYDGSMESLSNYSLARIRDAKVTPEFDLAREQGLIHVGDRTDADLLIRAAAYERVDGVTMARMAGLWSAKKQGLDKRIKVTRPILGAANVYIAFSKWRMPPEVADKMGELLKQYSEDGTLDRIEAQYINSDYGTIDH